MGDTPITEYAPLLARMQYDGVELVGDPERVSAREMRAVLLDNGLSVLAVMPTNDADPAHPLPSQRQRSIDYYRELLEFCVELGCSRLVIREKPGRIRPIVGRSKEWALYQQTLTAVAQSAANLNVRVSVLPVNRYEGYLINKANDALDVIQQQSQQQLDIALNTYHMNIEEASIRVALQKVGRYLGIFYASENHRRVVGEGHIDWPDICLALKNQEYSGDIIVECQAPGADPLVPVGRSPDWPAEVLENARRSIENLRVALAAVYT
jgi:sugar phosphate isomerase/epimerase